MKITRLLTLSVLASRLALATSCKKDDEDPMEGTALMPMDQSSTFDYKFNNGQVATGTHYNGMHKDDLTATMVVDQLTSGEAKISVTLTNTVDGEMASTSQISTESFTSLTTVYNGFFVTHDPLQPIDTTDPTTYVLLGLMAR